MENYWLFKNTFFMFPMPKSKVHSFSLVEMLVVMVLSSFIVGVIYFTYYTVNSYQITLTRKYALNEERSSLYYLLKKDFDKSAELRTVHMNELGCYDLTGRANALYFFNDEFVWRKQGTRVDTFYCKMDSLRFLRMGQPITMPDEQIDEVQMILLDFAVPVRLNLVKEYDRAALIETSIDSIQ